MGLVFNRAWRVATLILENGATDRQIELIISTTGLDFIYCFQEYTRSSINLLVQGRPFTLFSHGAARKHLAIAVPQHFTREFWLRHFTEEYFYYAIEFRTFLVINVHLKRTSLEQYEQQLQHIGTFVRRFGSKPIIIAGDLNSSFGIQVDGLVGEDCGDTRPTSGLLVHFVSALQFIALNSFHSLGPTRRPPLSRPDDVRSHLDWVLTRNCQGGFCQLSWPADWEGPPSISTDHAILSAGSTAKLKVPRNNVQGSLLDTLKGWMPPHRICMLNSSPLVVYWSLLLGPGKTLMTSISQPKLWTPDSLRRLNLMLYVKVLMPCLPLLCA